MNEWIFTVFIISIVGCIAKILLPNGKTKNYLVFILSMVAICSLILPLGNFSDFTDNLDLSFSDFESETVSEDYLSEYRQNYYYTLASNELKKQGIEINKITFIFDENNDENSLKKINIFYGDIVMNKNNQHINITSITKSILSKLFNVKEEIIEIYE